MSPNVNPAILGFSMYMATCLTYIAMDNLTSAVAEIGKQAAGGPRNHS